MPVVKEHFFACSLLVETKNAVFPPRNNIISYFLGLLLITLLSAALQTTSGKNVTLLIWTLELSSISEIVLYVAGFVGLIVLLSSIYMVMPVGQIKLRYALAGGTAAAVLWELVRHLLIWYFSALSMVNIIYGSMATAVIALLSLEVAGMILLVGAQFIAEYERFCFESEEADFVECGLARDLS